MNLVYWCYNGRVDFGEVRFDDYIAVEGVVASSIRGLLEFVAATTVIFVGVLEKQC